MVWGSNAWSPDASVVRIFREPGLTKFWNLHHSANVFDSVGYVSSSRRAVYGGEGVGVRPFRSRTGVVCWTGNASSPFNRSLPVAVHSACELERPNKRVTAGGSFRTAINGVARSRVPA